MKMQNYSLKNKIVLITLIVTGLMIFLYLTYLQPPIQLQTITKLSDDIVPGMSVKLEYKLQSGFVENGLGMIEVVSSDENIPIRLEVQVIPGEIMPTNNQDTETLNYENITIANKSLLSNEYEVMNELYRQNMLVKDIYWKSNNLQGYTVRFTCYGSTTRRNQILSACEDLISAYYIHVE